MKHIKNGILLGFLLLLLSSAYSQSNGFLPARQLVIINSTENNIGYSLSFDQETWQDIRIVPGKKQTYEIPKPHKFFYFNIVTEDRAKSYRLIPRKRYQLYWNKKEEVYDLAIIETGFLPEELN